MAGLPVTAIGYVGTRRGNIREDIVKPGGNANSDFALYGAEFFYWKGGPYEGKRQTIARKDGPHISNT